MEEKPINKQLVPLSIVIAGGLIALAVYFGGNSGSTTPSVKNDTDNNTSQANVLPVTNRDHILGNKNAKIVIVEYSDTECPFCKIFHETMHQVVNDYNGQVAWVYRQFPIVQLHPKAPKESEATECVNELGGNEVFWNYLDKIFETTNSNNSLDPAELPKLAVAVGLNETTFNECLSSGKYSEFVKKSVEEAVAAGALGTPYSVIVSKGNPNVVINGAQSITTVKSMIDSLLK